MAKVDELIVRLESELQKPSRAELNEAAQALADLKVAFKMAFSRMPDSKKTQFLWLVHDKWIWK